MGGAPVRECGGVDVNTQHDVSIGLEPLLHFLGHFQPFFPARWHLVAIVKKLQQRWIIFLLDPIGPDCGRAAPYMDWIEVKRLVTDKTYQREISRAGSINVERIAEYFEWAKFSPVIVAPVEGGMFSIIDGQHRATAAMLRGIEKVPCEIVHIDRARQAEAFAAINGNITRVSAQVVYYARLTGKDPEAEEMARVLSAAEVTVCRGAKTLRTMKRG